MAFFDVSDSMKAVERWSNLRTRLAVAASGVVLLGGQAHAQTIDCYDRALPMPQVVTYATAESCHRKVIDENTTNDRHAIALYNAARLYTAAADRDQDPAQRKFAYDRAVADVIESRDRASDTNTAFLNPWRKGDKRSKAAQMVQNHFFLANRSYQLGKAYFELSKLDGASACASSEICLERAAAELEQDAVARAAGAFRNEYVSLRADVYLAWGQSAQARRDLEFLKEDPAHGAAALQKLGQMYLADARAHLTPPITEAGVRAARVDFTAALGVPAAAIEARLGIGDTYLLEAGLNTEPAKQRTLYSDAVREFSLAVGALATTGGAHARLRAYEGRGTGYLQLGMLGDAEAFTHAVDDLKLAAQLDTTVVGAPAQLKLARALARAGSAAMSDAAYVEAERRFGSDPQAALARAERAFERGKRYFANAENAAAKSQFMLALAETGWREGRADAYYFLSAIDLKTGVDAVAHADAASTAGGGGSPYREQACLARIAAGGQAVLKKDALPACAGSDVLVGMFHLRHAQLAKTAAAATESRRIAQDAFMRARNSADVLRTAPNVEAVPVSDLASLGSAVALGCSTAAGISVPVDLDAARLDRAKAFFALHRVHTCVASY